MKKIIPMAILYIFLTALLVVTIFPILYAFLASFKSNSEVLTAGVRLLPNNWIVDNYVKAWKIANFAQYTWNSVYMTAILVVGSIVTGTMCGYVFDRGNFPGKKLIFGIFTSTMFISMGTVSLLPLLEIAKALKINTTLWGVIIIKLFGINVTGIYLVRGYLKSIPRELDEAAIIDGCSFFAIYAKIIFFMLKPIIATIGMLTFISSWNDYMLPMVFTISNLKQAPLTVGIVSLKSSGAVASEWNVMLAGSMISIIPLILLYSFLNRYFISGLTSGAVKG